MTSFRDNPHNKRMQSDLLKRYALASAADARRYVANKLDAYNLS
jgi:hypothetical protein